MVEQHDADDSIQEQGIGTALKRRGILAAAGVALAGMVAKQTAQPVRASQDFNFTAKDGSGTAFNVATGGYSSGVSATGSNYALYGSTASGYGVFAVTSGTGVSGYAGVYGGAGGTRNYGVQGVGSGVSGTGVRGESGPGIGVHGVIPAIVGSAPPVSNTAANTVGVQGTNQSTGTGGRAMYGLMDAGTATGTMGIYGANVTNAADAHGIIGLSNHGHGLVGVSNAPGSFFAGLVGNAGSNGANAGNFYGNVAISGTLNGHTAIIQHAQVAVAHPDGTHRLAQPVVSPEGWMEDFGKGALANGQTTITIDPAFAALADLSDYHVFLTEYDDHHALFVGKQTAKGFEVRAKGGVESAGPAGAVLPSGKFGYRVVAKRKDGQAERLATYTFPHLAPPHLPDPPKAAVPQAKP